MQWPGERGSALLRTALSADEINQPIRDAAVAALLSVVRKTTREDWQLVERIVLRRRWGLRRKVRLYELYVNAGGSPPWRCVNYQLPRTVAAVGGDDGGQVVAFLLGLLAGVERGRARTAWPSPTDGAGAANASLGPAVPQRESQVA